MADPIPLIHTAFALLAGPARPEIGDIVTIALCGSVSFEIDATVDSLEISDDGEIAVLVDATVDSLEISDDGEIAVLVDDTGCRWALPVASLERASA